MFIQLNPTSTSYPSACVFIFIFLEAKGRNFETCYIASGLLPFNISLTYSMSRSVLHPYAFVWANACPADFSVTTVIGELKTDTYHCTCSKSLN